MSNNTGEFGIVANVKQDSVLRDGAKVYLTWLNPGNAQESVQVTGRSFGGRRIFKMIRLKKLENFRAAWVPEKIRKHKKALWAWYDTKAEAQEMAEGLNHRT